MNWYRMDLHLHTPASSDYKDSGVTYLQFLQQAEAKALDILAITDHNTVAGYAKMWDEVEDLLKLEKTGRLSPAEKATLSEYRRLSEKIMVLPGFEVTATLGFHIIGVFPPGTSVRKLEHILLNLNIPEEKIELGSSEVGSTSDVLTCYREIAEAGGLVIAAHANSSHGVAMQGWDFVGGQTRIAYTQDKNLHALEVTDLESTSRRSTRNFFNGSKPEYPRRMHCIQSSDAHRLLKDVKDKGNPWGVGDRATEVMLETISFDGLKDLFQGNDFNRTRPARPAAAAPFDPIKAARTQGPSIIQSFHEVFSPKSPRLTPLISDVAALANTNGGSIYVGLSANPKVPAKGVERPEEAAEAIRNEVVKAVIPRIDVDVAVHTSEGRKILEVKVPKGNDTPYVLGNSQIFVRQESETAPAMRDEIIRLVEQGRPRPVAVTGPVEKPAEGVTQAPSAPAPPPVAAEPDASAASPVPAVTLPVPAPRTGVEVIASEQEDNVWHHTVQDLRNGNIVRNVTHFSARHLWRYAISEREKNPVQEDQVTWHGDLGLWKTYKRAGVKRYNLVQRDSQGGLHVYYGATEDGMQGPWAQFVQEPEPEQEPEQAPELKTEQAQELEAAQTPEQRIEEESVQAPEPEAALAREAEITEPVAAPAESDAPVTEQKKPARRRRRTLSRPEA
jgi:hypothetical protein